MPRSLLYGLAAGLVTAERASSYTSGGVVSLGEAALQRGLNGIVPEVEAELAALEIPGHNLTLVQFDTVKFESVSVGSATVDVVKGRGVQVSLTNMANTIGHTHFCVNDLFHIVKCCGEVWGSASGGHYTSTSQVVTDGEHIGTLNTVVGSFDMGTIQLHHKMQSTICEIGADIIHILNSAVIDVVKRAMNRYVPEVVMTAVDTPINEVLKVLAHPPALGVGSQRYELDNGLVAVSYDKQRITHWGKGEFKPAGEPGEDPLSKMSTLAMPTGKRDLYWDFSEYVVNSLFDGLFQQRALGWKLRLPFVHSPLSDKACPKCPIVMSFGFKEPARASFAKGKATHTLRNCNLTLGAEDPQGAIIPLVSLNLNAVADGKWTLSRASDAARLRVELSLESFTQKLTVSHIGNIDTSDLNRDVKDLLTAALDNLNQHNPGLILPSLAGVKLANEDITLNKGLLQVSADLVAANAQGSLIV